MRTIEEIEKRMAEIKNELEKPEADLDALQEEVRKLNAEREELRKAAAAAEEKRRAIAAGLGGVVESHEEKKSLTVDEIRNSKKYIDAYAEYIKTGDPKECRAMLTENAPTNGQLPVPVLVEQIVRTAWERDGIMSRVRRTYFGGNLKIAFELSADGAIEHIEGSGPVAEEDLQLGIVTLIPRNIKKFIRISDEVVAMGGEAFLRYVYDELTYQIVKKLAALIIADIVSAPAESTKTQIGVPVVSQAAGINTIATAAANLSDEATDVVVIMNRLTEVNFRAAYAAGNFAVDPFAGLPRVYTSALKAYDVATAGETYAIVGDLNGAQVNYPEGDGVVIKYDDLTEDEEDMVKIVGRQYAAHGVTGPGRFVKINKA